MNYSELVTSKSPLVYVNYDGGTNYPSIGQIYTNTTIQLNPVYDPTAKQHGLRSKRIGSSGSGNYDNKTYGETGITAYQSVKYHYWHQEFWVFLTATPTGATNIGGFGYWNVNSTLSVMHTSQILSTTRQINFGTGGTAHTMTSVNGVPVNAWTHIALQYDMGVKRIYINGVLDSTATVTTADGCNGVWTEPGANARVTTYFDEVAFWGGRVEGSKPANFPTEADILQRATFPRTSTKVWYAPGQFWIASGDERFWNGTQWVSMQQMTYRSWNGTDWVQVPSG